MTVAGNNIPKGEAALQNEAPICCSGTNTCSQASFIITDFSVLKNVEASQLISLLTPW
jgi:hypothetical protein